MKPNILPTNDQDLSWIIDDALSRLASRMEQAAPFMAQQIDRWTQELCQGSQGAYYKHPLGFPVLLFPWWLEKTVQRIPDTGFQADIVYSTINGYYFVRLIDNLMDGHTTRELRLLPALGFFHSQFQAPYQRYFDHRHPFWEYFERVWLQSAEVTIRDAHLTDLSWDEFLQIAAKKSCAAKIPLTAVCYRYGREDRIAPWSQFLDLFSRWHQMWNDVIGWHGDLRNGIGTLFLSEADRRRGLNESVTEWVIREGLGWGIDICRTWMDELRLLARGLNSNDLETYLQERESMLIEQKEQIAEGLQTVDRYLDLLSKT
jgi:hypothetical protein